MRLEDLLPGVVVRGLVPHGPATVAANHPVGKQATVITYRSPAGSVDEVVVYRTQEPDLVSDEESRPWSFTDDLALFRLATDAARCIGRRPRRYRPAVTGPLSPAWYR